MPLAALISGEKVVPNALIIWCETYRGQSSVEYRARDDVASQPLASARRRKSLDAISTIDRYLPDETSPARWLTAMIFSRHHELKAASSKKSPLAATGTGLSRAGALLDMPTYRRYPLSSSNGSPNSMK